MTRVEVVPPIVLALARHPAVLFRYDLSSLRLITSGGAPLGAALAGECADRLGCRVKQAYGMTEFGGATHIVPDTGGGDPELDRPAAAGQREPGDRLCVRPRRGSRGAGRDADPVAGDDDRLPQ